MPRIRCSDKGKPGFKWGTKGHCYTYTFGDKAGRRRAELLAGKQGQAAHAAGYGK